MHALLLTALLGVTDPGAVLLSVPPQWAEVGVPWRIYWDDLVTYQGAWSYSVTWSISPVPSTAPSAVTGGLTWTPAEADAGTYTLSVAMTDGGATVASYDAQLVVSTAGAITAKVSVFGDSISAAGKWQAHVAASEPGITWLGSVAVAQGIAVDSRSGWLWSHWTAQPGSPASPLYCGPESYKVLVNNVPDVVVWAGGTNDAFWAPSATWSISNAIDRLDSLIYYWRRFYPATKHVIWTAPPANANATTFATIYADWVQRDQYYVEQRIRAVTREVIRRYAGREHEGIYVAAIASCIDTASGYPANDALHPTADGYTHLGDAMRAVMRAATR